MRRLWHTYRDSTRRTYAHLGGAVPEWEAYYSKHDASAYAEPNPQHLVDATTAPRRAALRKVGGGAHGRAMRDDRPDRCYSADKTWEPCERTRAPVTAPWVGDPI